VVYGPFLAGAFLVIAGIPAWWLGYLAMLARPAGPQGDLEWYPAGRLVLWAAVIGPLVVAMAIPNFGLDYESFRAALRANFERILESSARPGAGQQPPGQNLAGVIDAMVMVVPIAAALVSTLTTLVNLWLAGTVVRLSGRLRRPWPDLPALALPRSAALVLGGAALGTLLPGIPGLLAGAVAASFTLAHAVQGFAVLHVLTRGMVARGLMLGAAYACALLVGWPVLVVALLGLAETVFHLRARALSKPPPPAPPLPNRNTPT